MTVVYLHGFASSPQSRKAQFFGCKFREAGVPFEVPELGQGSFEKLTITGQLNDVYETVSRSSVASDPIVLIGSNLGGYLAALYAHHHPRSVDRLGLTGSAVEA